MIKPKCAYFERDKFCAKGIACEFYHDNLPPELTPVCKNFATPTGCKFGDACRFRHNKPKKQSSNPLPPPRSSRSVSTTVQVKNTPEEKKTVIKETKFNASAATAAAWGFEDDDGVYFYGAPGTFEAPEQKLRYVQVVGTADSSISGSYSFEANAPTSSFKAASSNAVCPFFLSNGCKFGSKCKYIHSMPIEATDATTDRRADMECGICMGFPDNGTYGILSNCNCIFCLDCIRGWRSEGLAIVHENAQVRLCPLCRVDSHIVCPSSSPVFGAVKEALFDAYKKNMSKKKCKYYEEKGECPFGTSCFYRHGDEVEGGAVAQSARAPNRIIYRSDGKSEDITRRAITISDAIFRAK